MIRTLLQWVAVGLGLITFPVGILLMMSGYHDLDVIAQAMATVIILCGVVWFVCHDLEYLG